MSSWQPTEPTWATPPQREIADLMWLAYRLHVDNGRPWSAGVMDAVAWVRGGRSAPVTDRGDQPVTRGMVEAEEWAAMAVHDPESCSELPLERIAAAAGVVWREPLAVHPEYALGVWHVARWLLGVRSQERPLPLPVRNADGSLLTADQLYEQTIAADPHWYRAPEQRNALRDWAEAEAGRLRALEALIVDTQAQQAAALRARRQASA